MVAESSGRAERSRSTSEGPGPAEQRRLAGSRFATFLRDNGLKLTVERQAILAEFYRVRSHIEVEELLLRLRQAGSRVSRATIYRTLELIVQAGLARRVRLGTEQYYYERVLARRQHEHMICLHCGGVTEWFDPDLAELLQRNVREHRFWLARQSVQLYGYCDACAGTSEAQRARQRVIEVHVSD